MAEYADFYEIEKKSSVASKPLRDNFDIAESKLNDLDYRITNILTPPTGSEVTDARDYHSILRDRLRSASKTTPAAVVSGGVVSAQTVPDMTVQVAATEAVINGIACKVPASNSGTITAPATNPRYDIVVIADDSTLAIVTGTEAVAPTYPIISSSQKALAIIALTAGATEITAGMITDCRSMGAYYMKDGRMQYKFSIQDAIDDIAIGEIYITPGLYPNPISADDSINLLRENGANINVVSGNISGRIRRQIFTASGTWYKPAGVTRAKVLLVAGGGKGGAGGVWGGTFGGGGGGGGGAGQICDTMIDVASDITITIGASEQNSSFGSLLTAYKGLNGGNGVDGDPSSSYGGDGGKGADAKGFNAYAKDNAIGANSIGEDGHYGGGAAGGGAYAIDPAYNGGIGGPTLSYIGGTGGIGGHTGIVIGGGGGGGGGSAGYNGPGGNGGNGGDISAVPQNGYASTSYGGGGGGGGGMGGAGGTNGAGGAGGPGICIVEWEE